MTVTERIREEIASALAGAQTAAVWWSSGHDSQLLLHLVREQRPDVAVVWFRQSLHKRQMEFMHEEIARLNLAVYAVTPQRSYVMNDGKGEISLVDVVMLNGVATIVGRDVQASERCLLRLKMAAGASYEYPFDVTFVGWKHVDTHPAFGQIPCPRNGTARGGTKFYAPLRDLSEAETWELIGQMGVRVDERRYAGDETCNPDTLFACTRCLTSDAVQVWCPDEQREIPVWQWDRQEPLRILRRLCEQS